MDQQFYLDEKIVREGDGSFLTYGRRQLQNIETFFKKNSQGNDEPNQCHET